MQNVVEVFFNPSHLTHRCAGHVPEGGEEKAMMMRWRKTRLGRIR
jgi:hypothetical protein